MGRGVGGAFRGCVGGASAVHTEFLIFAVSTNVAKFLTSVAVNGFMEVFANGDHSTCDVYTQLLRR